MFNLAGLVSYVVVANLSPGPNAVLSMAHAGKLGFKKSILFNFGVAVGVFAVLLLCGFFSRALFDCFPALQTMMVWAGAAYLLWLAWGTVQNKPGAKTSHPAIKGGLFFQGAVLQFFNPNTILYGITVFSTFILPHYRAAPVLVLFCALLAVAALFCTACWTVFGAVFQTFIAKHAQLVSAILAALLVYCAVSLVLGAL